MTITEATHVNTLLLWAMSKNRPYHGPISDGDATEAARYLTERAYKALLAGLHPEDVTLDRAVCAPAMRTVQTSLELARRAQGGE